jgi:hypothetical protein
MIGKVKSEVKPILDLINPLILQSPAALLHHAETAQNRAGSLP